MSVEYGKKLRAKQLCIVRRRHCVPDRHHLPLAIRGHCRSSSNRHRRVCVDSLNNKVDSSFFGLWRNRAVVKLLCIAVWRFVLIGEVAHASANTLFDYGILYVYLRPSTAKPWC